MKEKHPLFWELGQLAVTAGGMVWFLGGPFISDSIRLPACAVLLSIGMIGYWSGMQFFIGALRRHHIRWMIPVLILMSAGFSLIWRWNKALLAPGSAIALGIVMF